MAAIRNRIYIGSREEPIFYFENDSILSADVVQRVALVGTELSVDSFTPVVMDDEENLHDIYHFRSSDGQEIVDALGETFCIDMAEGTNLSPLAYLENGTPVLYFQENTLIGRFYLKSVERVGRNQYQLNTVSAIGMLDEMDHGGGLFTATTFGAVLAHILASGLHGTGDPVIPYVIDQEVADLPVNGYLPHDTKRNNLYQLIFANGVNIVKNVDSRDEYNGVPRFTFLYSSPESAEPVAQIYNEGSVDYNKPYTNVVVMEHTYTPVTTEVPVTLFDNTTGTAASDTEVWFDQAPIIVSSLTVSGTLKIKRDPITDEPLATENSVILEEGNGTLTGIPYLHDTRTINMGDSGASDEKTIRVENATFVNLINSENLLRRLYAFYCPEHFIHKISDGIVYENIVVDGISHDPPRCGKVYRLKDPYGKEETAYLSSMNITASAINKAECEWYAGYVPVGQSGLYDNVDVLRPYWDEEEEEWVYEGEWEVPDNVTEIKVVIIGGGTGGGSGWPGENGQDGMSYTEVESTADLSAVWYGAEGGEGGAGGSGGTPGRIKVVTLSVTPGDTFSYAIGQGGQGGAATGFIPDTVAELRAALENEDPDTEYTDAQIEAMIAQEDTDWSGTPNAGTAGTASSFGSDSSADPEGYVPAGGFYDSINDHYYALAGYGGIHGGKGGARQVKSGTVYTWITDGEDVTGEDGTVYRGGSTGNTLTNVAGLPEASGKIRAYGGNGAGAAVGIDRSTHEHINGGSDQETEWYIAEDE